MFRIILIVILILLAVPFFNKAKDYISDKAWKAKAVGAAAGKAIESGAQKAEDAAVKMKEEVLQNPVEEQKK